MKVLWFTVAVTAALLASAAHAQSPSPHPHPNAGRALAATCFTCHGTDGRSVGGVPPSLAGMNRDVMVQQMKDFRDGKRPATIMHQHAKGYTDAQFVLIADYFASVSSTPSAPSAKRAPSGTSIPQGGGY